MNLGLAAFAALFAIARPAAAQCAPEWVPAFPQGDLGFDSHLNVRAYALTAFDADGAGPGLPSLCVAGDFRTAGGIVVNGIALWNGSSWSGLGGGLDNMEQESYPDVLAVASFDEDGSGPNPPRLFAAGNFGSMGGHLAYGVARWNGVGWTPIAGASGQGIGGIQPYSKANALAAFDDDGAGPHPEALYVGGEFTSAGGVAASYIAKWDGTSWSAVGGGMDRTVRALLVFDDDGSGPQLPSLYAGGEFNHAGGTDALHIARWDGSSWSALGSGVSAFVSSMTAWDSDGAGPLPTSLYVGGELTSIQDNLFRWDGASWTSIGLASGGSPNYDVRALLGFEGDGSSPPRLFAGGDFTEVDGVPARGIAQWDGASWSACGTGVRWYDYGLGLVHALAAFDDDGPGPHPATVFADGFFTQAGSINADAIATWDGANWTALGTGIGGGWTTVNCLAVHDEDGSGPAPSALYAGGDFGVAGEVGRNIARWDGSSWSTVGGGVDGNQSGPVGCMSVFDEDGAGPAPARLFVGGAFTSAAGVAANHIARWDGSTWSDVGGGVEVSGTYGGVSALLVFDADGTGPGSPALIAGGRFILAGGASAAHVAQWDGSTWSPLGSGLNDDVLVLAAYDDDGAGPHAAALYAGGSFTASGPASVNYVARWDGTSWTQVGMGTNGPVAAMTVYDADGAGPLRPRLVAGGTCSVIGGFITRVGSWDGYNWAPLNAGVAGYVRGLTVFDEDGTGPALPALFAAGIFATASGATARNIARWDGASWAGVGGGINGVRPSNNAYVNVLTAFDEDGSGPGPGALYAGGRFDHAGSVASAGIARWNGCGSLVTSFCADAGCPCGNDGAPRRGCQNSAGTGGALLTANGNAGVTGDTFVFHTSGELPSALSVLLQGNASIGPVVFGDGLRCVGGSLKRLYTKSASGGSVTAPAAGDRSVSRRSGELGDGLHAGAARYYQVYYRDPNASFCPSPPGNTWNVSNAIAVSWSP